MYYWTTKNGLHKILSGLDLKEYIGDSEILDALNFAQKENVDIINASGGGLVIYLLW